MPKSRKRSRVTSEDIADNLGKLSICAALLNQIFLAADHKQVLTYQEKQYCVEMDSFLRSALQDELYEDPDFAAGLELMQDDLTKLAILQQTRLAEIAQSIARAATEEVNQRLQELLILQKEIISAAKKSKISKVSFIMLMRRINNALAEGDYVHRNFSEISIDIREHFRIYIKTNKQARPPLDLYEECLNLLDVIASSNIKGSLTMEERKTCHQILSILRQAKETFEYKNISFHKKLEEIYPNLVTLACNQQMRIKSIAKTNAEDIMFAVKIKVQSLSRLFEKVRNAAATINPGVVIQLMQNINDSLINGEYAHPKFNAKLSQMQITLRRFKKSIAFNEAKIAEEITYVKVPHKTTGYFAKLRRTRQTDANKENKPDSNNRRTFT